MNRKNYLIPAIALTGLALTAGGFAAGHATRTTESDPATTITAHCTEMQRPDDPAGVIGSNWPDMTVCDKLASSARIHSPVDLAVRSAAESIRSAQEDIIDAAHPGVPPTQARLTITAIRGDLSAALARYAVPAVGAPAVDYTEVR